MHIEYINRLTIKSKGMLTAVQAMETILMCSNDFGLHECTQEDDAYETLRSTHSRKVGQHLLIQLPLTQSNFMNSILKRIHGCPVSVA